MNLKIFLLSSVFLWIWPFVALAGDRPWWTWQDSGGGSWGIGEIGDRLLFYLGHSHWMSPVPTTKMGLALCLLLVAVLVVLVKLVYRFYRKPK